MTETYSEYDAADYLKTEDQIRLYLEACAEDNNPELMVVALGDAIRARSNIAALSDASGLSRQGIYKAITPKSKPSFVTVAKLADAMGYRLQFVKAKLPKLPKGAKVAAPRAKVARGTRTLKDSAEAHLIKQGASQRTKPGPKTSRPKAAK
jgi:probable addiction module antidote protein